VLHLEGDFDLNEPIGDWYSRLTDAYVGWSPSKNLSFKFLKQSAGFTLDGATSSKSLLTMQRNNLTNNLWFTREYFAGIGARGTADQRWSYNVGIFSSDDHDEISPFATSYFGLLSLGYKFEVTPKRSGGFVRVDYVYNDEHPASGTRDFSHVLSLVSKWQFGRWSIWSDLSGGKGYAEQSDVWGLVVMPFFDLSPRYQVVVRYSFVTSKDANGVRLPRYAGQVIDGRGDEYNEAYFGFNVFFYGHKLKWQTGVDYEHMKDAASDSGGYDGWGFNTGIRISW
jgi:phosphate-selective porin OprO/OprP